MKRNLAILAALVAVLSIGWFLGASSKDISTANDRAPAKPSTASELAGDASTQPGDLIGKAPAGPQPRPPLRNGPTASITAKSNLPDDPRHAALVAQQKVFFIEDVARRKLPIFAQFGAMAGLDADAMDSLTRLLASREVDFMESIAMRRDENGRIQPPTREEVASHRRETDALVQDSLTPEQFAAYQEYSVTVPERAIVEMVRTVDPAAEITTTQQERLVEILFDARQSVVRNGASSPEQIMQNQAVAFEEAVRQSTGILSPEAQTALAGVLNELSTPKGPSVGSRAGVPPGPAG